MCHHWDIKKPMSKTLPALVGLLFFSAVMAAQIPPSGLKASFTHSPKFPMEGQAVQFTDASKGNPTSWRWDFGDGSTSIQQNPSHVFATPGLKKVTLVVARGAGSKRSIRTITVTPQMTAASLADSPKVPKADEPVQNTDTSALSPSFNFFPSVPAVNQAVQFTDASIGTPNSWQWSFGDGSSSSLQDPSHGYSAAGSYTVNLTVSNGTASATTSRAVTVAVAPPPGASFSFSPPAPVAGQAILFKDTSTDSPAYWRWDFADGTTSQNKNPSHTFTYPGFFNVTLTATNAYGSHTASGLVFVSSADTLAANFTYAPDAPVAGQTITFKDTSAGTTTSWLWSFGDGKTSTSRNPRYAYLDAGIYTVTLTVTSVSSTSTVTKIVSVVEEELRYRNPE
jgi:PKD repeat protein